MGLQKTHFECLKPCYEWEEIEYYRMGLPQLFSLPGAIVLEIGHEPCSKLVVGDSIKTAFKFYPLEGCF
jgi:hypothetical protein